MIDKRNVLVFPCGSEIGLEIHNSLRYSTHFTVFGGSSVDDHGMFVFENYIGSMPYIDDPRFTQKLNDVIKKYGIDFIIPAHDSVIVKLAREKAKGRLDCDVITSPAPTCELTRSKLKTYKRFAGVVPVPRVYEYPNTISSDDFPVFLKPDVGQGSRGIYTAKSHDELNFYKKLDPSLLILELLPGQMYTVECFTSRNGELIFCEGRERARVQNGISVNTYTVENPTFTEMAGRINDEIELRGAWFFQVKESSAGVLTLMEVAPRIAGTMSLLRSKGINLVLMSLFEALEYGIDVVKNDYRIEVDRALGNSYQHDLNYRHVYLDFDDLVIHKDKVNPLVMAFVFQCMNNNVKIHLLTKHKENLEDSLNKYRLNGLFDELIWLKDGEQKHTYIKEKDSIFIDDSFSERKTVKEKCNLPVFDAHMIEGLMEKF
ncbi:MAG: ATP-grasp domain-containing protein [Candidatus Saccharimonadales bacterium]